MFIFFPFRHKPVIFPGSLFHGLLQLGDRSGQIIFLELTSHKLTDILHLRIIINQIKHRIGNCRRVILHSNRTFRVNIDRGINLHTPTSDLRQIPVFRKPPRLFLLADIINHIIHSPVSWVEELLLLHLVSRLEITGLENNQSQQGYTKHNS